MKNGDFSENGKNFWRKRKNFGEDEKTSCQNTGENENDENEILYFLQNLERNLSQKYFSKKFFFFFFWRKLFSRNLLQILENPKNFMISFFHPLNLNRNLFLLKKIPLLPEKDQANSEELF